MTDDQFIAAFESCRLAREAFHHADHVRLAFLYLCRFSPLVALRRFTHGLEQFGAASGRPNLYHETISWAFVLLIRERMQRRLWDTGRHAAWEEFAADNPDLLSWKGHILKSYYHEESLGSEFARRTFVLPDRALNLSATASGRESR
jgi:hypothetical protein